MILKHYVEDIRDAAISSNADIFMSLLTSHSHRLTEGGDLGGHWFIILGNTILKIFKMLISSDRDRELNRTHPAAITILSTISLPQHVVVIKYRNIFTWQRFLLRNENN